MRWLMILIILTLLILTILFLGLFFYTPENNKQDEETKIKDPECIELGCEKDTSYVGSINSNKFYTCSCHYADRIKPENIICFKTREEAIKEGYEQIEDC